MRYGSEYEVIFNIHGALIYLIGVKDMFMASISGYNKAIKPHPSKNSQEDLQAITDKAGDENRAKKRSPSSAAPQAALAKRTVSSARRGVVRILITPSASMERDLLQLSTGP